MQRRDCLTSANLLPIPLLILLILLVISGSASASYYERAIIENDTLLIQIQPVVEDLTIRYDSQSSKSVSVSYAINQSGYTNIWIMPESAGTLNITLVFRTTAEWNQVEGIITDKPDLYKPPYIDVQPYYGLYSIVMLSSDSGLLPGNFTRSYILSVHASSASFFSFELPESINAVFFVAVVASLGYVNAFFLLDLHFKSKTEGVSRKRQIIIALLFLVSLYIAYQMYIFTTFTSAEGI